MARRWSEDDIDYLIAFSLDPEGEKIKDAARFLERTENAVKNKLAKLRKDHGYVGYLERRWTDREKQMLLNAQYKMTYKEIGKKINRTEAAVMLMVQRLGIQREITHPDVLQMLENEMKSLAEQGYTRNEIAKKVGIDYKVIKNYLLYRGIECKYEKQQLTEQQRKKHNSFMRKATKRF